MTLHMKRGMNATFDSYIWLVSKNKTNTCKVEIMKKIFLCKKLDNNVLCVRNA